MDFIYGVAHFGAHFKSVQVGVRLASSTGSDNAMTFVVVKARHKTKPSANTSNGPHTHPSSFRHRFRIHSSWCENFLHNGCNRYNNSVRTKSRLEMNVGAKRTESTSRSHLLASARFSDPSESAQNFPPQLFRQAR